MKFKAQVLDELSINKALKRISHEIVENCTNLDNVVLFGIKTRGVPIANIIANNIKSFENVTLPVGELDITLYRDDLTTISESPVLNGSEFSFTVEGKDVILVDDVIYTGRTIRAAIDAVFAIGRPNRIMLAVLIDRGHRELPIRGDFVGKNIPTSHKEVIAVNIQEIDGKTDVEVLEK